MSDSGLITYSAISPNCNRPRRYPISKITPHHMAGNLSLKQIAEIEGRPARRMSSNYAIASNGDIALLCHEADRSWCSSSPENDHRAITIEVANDQIGGNWHVSDAAFESLIALCVDICQRNPALASGLNYTGDARGNLTKHSYFKNTACPGPYLGSRFGDLAKEVNRRLLGNQQEQQETELRAGMALHLTGTSLFAASTSQIVAGTRAGTYYLWGSAIVNGRVRITNSTANVGKSGKVTGWIDAAVARAAAGIKDQAYDNRGLYTLEIHDCPNRSAYTIYQSALLYDLVQWGYYRAKYCDAAKTKQFIQIGQISKGDADALRMVCNKLSVDVRG